MPDQITGQIHDRDIKKVREGKRSPEPSQKSSQDLPIRLIPFVGYLGTSATKPSLDRHIALLSDSRLYHHANAIQRARIANELQHCYGNAYLQRVVAGIREKTKTPQAQDIYKQESKDQVMRMSETDVRRQSAEKEEKEPIQPKSLTEQIKTKSVPLVQRGEDPGAPVAPAGAVPAPAGAPAPRLGRPSPDNRTRHEIVVLDFGVNTDIVNWRNFVTHIGAIEAASVDQMVADVMARTGDPANNCISRLVLRGHGSPGNISVGDGTGWVAEGNISSGNFRPSLNQLTRYFCDDATVVLTGCNVGRGVTGATFIQRLADFWHVNVAAPTGKTNGFGIMGVWVWGLPGQVLPNDPMLIVDQIVRILDETTYGDDEEMIFDLLEAGKDRGLLNDIRAELVRQGRWDGLSDDLRDEDEDRYNRL